jgi:hypothetical protein
MAAAVSSALDAGAVAPVARVRVLRASEEELAAHRAMCERIEKESKGQCLWLRLAEAAMRPAEPVAVPA